MKKYLILISIIGLTVGAVVGSQALTLSPPPRASIPVQLSIPVLNINATIETVGLDADNRMSIPENTANVAWYQYGSRPGERGNAVIAGHLDSKTGPAVFTHIAQLQPGDQVQVLDAQNRRHNYIVTKKESYPDKDFPIKKIFGPTAASQLNLITCDGVYNNRNQNYSHRLVIFTELSQ